jgi:dihydrofolate reductase
MRQLKIIEHISLDGVIQAPGGPNEEGDYPYGGWTQPYRDPAAGKAVLAVHGEFFDLLLGRRIYDVWSGFRLKAPSSLLADSLNAATKYVVTHRPDSLVLHFCFQCTESRFGGYIEGLFVTCSSRHRLPAI